MVQRHNSPAPLRFGSFGSSCSCFASLRPTGGPQNQKRAGRSSALPLPFLPSLPLFGCSCSLGGFSAAALCSYRTQQRRAAALRCLPAGLCLSCGEGGHRVRDTTKAGRLSAACSCPALLLCSCGLFFACRLPPVWRLPSLWLCRAFLRPFLRSSLLCL